MAGGFQENDLLIDIQSLMGQAQAAGGSVTDSDPVDQMEQADGENKVLLQEEAVAPAAAGGNDRRPKFGLLFLC